MARCKKCGQEITQGHRCMKDSGYKLQKGNKLSAPKSAEDSVFERIEINGNILFNQSGAQSNSKVFKEEAYLSNLKTIQKRINEKIKNFSAGCEPQ